MKSACLSHPVLHSDCSNLVRRNRFEGKGLHEGQEDGLGRFSLDRSLTLIDTCNLEILCKGARLVFLQDVRGTHCLLPVSGKVIKTLTTRTHALTLGAVRHVAHAIYVAGSPSSLSRIAERKSLNGFGTA